ncbi:MAG: GNAT family N-acetyltransferase [bacterium]
MEGPRGARREELSEIIDLSNRVFRTEVTGDMKKEFPLLFSPENCENLRIIKEDGKVVSLVGILFTDLVILGNRIKASLIGSVATDPDYRGKGFATTLMQDSIVRSLQEGVDLMLISGGRGLYRRLGAVQAGLYQTFFIPKAKLSYSDLTVRRIREEDIPKVLYLMALEPVRFERSYDELKKLISTRMVVNEPGEVLVVERKDTIISYFAIQIQSRFGKSIHIKEIGGSREAIVDALLPTLDAHQMDFILIDALSNDEAIKYIMEKRGIKPDGRGFQGTVKILNLKGLFKKLEPYFISLLGGEYRKLTIKFEPSLSLTYDEETLDIPKDDAPILIFGSVEKKIEIPEKLNKIKRIIDSIFPIPLVDYGLNYT